MTSAHEDPRFRFLAEGGETGREILAKDWRGSSLGPLAGWPVALRTTLATMLACPVAMFLAWGPDLLSFYNDPYREVLGDRVARTLGTRFPELWADLWQDIGPLCDRALSGESVSVHDLPLTMYRQGRPEQTWWTFSYSPVHDDSGAIAGMICITRETTAQVLAERAREESRNRLELALSAGDGIGTWDWDVAADRVTADARFARLYGVDPDRAAAGAPIAAFFGGIHPDDLPGMQERIATAMRTGGEFSAEYRLIHEDGVRWVAAQGQCVLDAEGRPGRFPGVTFDITERRTAEEALRAAAQELRLVADALPSLIAFIDPTLTYRFANAAYETWFSRPLSDVIGRTVRDLIDEDGFARRQPAFAAALAGEEIRFEMPWPHADGRERVADIRYIPRRDRDGAVDGFYAFVQDVTDRTRIEAALTREVESRTRERNRLWETTTDLMGTAGLDGYLKAVNPAWTRALGWSQDELLAEPFAAIIDTDDHAETAEILARLARGETVDGFVDHVIRKDGERLTVSWNAVPEGDLFYIVGRDITEQRAVEELLRQAQKMEAVGQLTGGIAHDFNNLLTGIVGSLDLMQTRIKQGRTEQIGKYATAALSSANRAAALTHRLLAFARRQPLEPKPTDANGLIAGMEDMLRRTLTEQVNLEIVTAGGLWLTLCDPHQLENALLNLAINARDAMPDGGRLVVETCNTHLDRAYARLHPEVEPGQYICVCVTDTGTGMPPDVVAKAFDPFFTTKPLGQGTGLGLSMIYGFAKQSEGHAKIYSEVGSGTTIKIYLPRYRGEAAAEGTGPGIAAALRAERGETVLVVEDDPVVRDLIVEVLAELGYAALEASDGPTGLRMVESRARIDLMVSDVGLPGLNGRQLADRARLVRPGLKVLFITGYAENAIFGNGGLDPGMQMITKPFPLEVLASRIREIIEG
ncbi:PAS domain-containing protein [Methylobacterium sp. WL120]|uniref:hybrid sensor histidine kinase/response regulator n=1 Tax=Methylobacterium sp. WL120 TaxID=2603887 RepID=UPI0011CCCFF7|nr:PAS domain-containing protein [Methylobacterium sp. WL120]TXM67899.1 PAS domain-containing protein [Methylobacterium sp. WL120]